MHPGSELSGWVGYPLFLHGISGKEEILEEVFRQISELQTSLDITVRTEGLFVDPLEQ